MPMGCSVSCAYFEAFSTFLQWALLQAHEESKVTHYLDDFLFIGEWYTQEFLTTLQEFQALAERLGVPLVMGKTEGPARF